MKTLVKCAILIIAIMVNCWSARLWMYAGYCERGYCAFGGELCLIGITIWLSVKAVQKIFKFIEEISEPS